VRIEGPSVEAHVTTRLTAFTDDELAYMRGERRLARLATAGVDGTPHVVPVVLSMGRVPEDSLAPALIERGLRVEEAGDCARRAASRRRSSRASSPWPRCRGAWRRWRCSVLDCDGPGEEATGTTC